MCLLCLEVAKQTMTPNEVARAFREVEILGDHFGEVLVEIAKNYDIDEIGKELSNLDPG